MVASELAQKIHTSSRTVEVQGDCDCSDKQTLQQIQQMFESGVPKRVEFKRAHSPDYAVDIKLPNKSSNFIAYGAAAEVHIPYALPQVLRKRVRRATYGTRER